MNIEYVEKKLREVRFFWDKMRERERRAYDDKEPYDFYLSAFLSAGRSVDYQLRHEQPAIYPTWRAAWDATLAPDENCLIKFMVDDRNVEVHESGSGRSVTTEDRKLAAGGTYSLASGTWHIMGSPHLAPFAIIRTPAYYFTIAGTERKATEACAEYLVLLERMAATFKADHP